MKTNEPFPEEMPPDESPSPLRGISALIVLVAIVAIALMHCSCAQLQSVPFSVSYTDDEGETFTITKLAQYPIHATK